MLQVALLDPSEPTFDVGQGPLQWGHVAAMLGTETTSAALKKCLMDACELDPSSCDRQMLYHPRFPAFLTWLLFESGLDIDHRNRANDHPVVTWLMLAAMKRPWCMPLLERCLALNPRIARKDWTRAGNGGPPPFLPLRVYLHVAKLSEEDIHLDQRAAALVAARSDLSLGELLG